MKYICLGIIVLFFIVLIKAILRINRQKQAYPYSSYSYKYDPRILERISNPESEMDMMTCYYKTNIPNGVSNSLKKLAIDNDLFEEESTMDFLKDN